MTNRNIMNKYFFQFIIICIATFSVMFMVQRVFVGLPFENTPHSEWKLSLFPPRTAPFGLFPGALVFFMVTFLAAVGASFLISTISRSTKHTLMASISLSIIAVVPTIFMFQERTSNCYCNMSILFKYQNELSIFLVISAICGTVVGPIFWYYLIGHNRTFPDSNGFNLYEKMRISKMTRKSKPFILIISGISIIAMVYLLGILRVDYYGRIPFIPGLIFIGSLILLLYGYKSITIRIETKAKCVLEGFIALTAPMLFLIGNFSVYNDFFIRYEILIIILILGVIGFYIGIMGYSTMKEGNILFGLRSKVIIRIILIITCSLSFLIMAFPARYLPY